MTQNPKLQNKIVWITGSGRGIGKAAAMQLAAQGARVVVSARSVDEIDRTAKEIHQNQGTAMAIRCDVTQPEQISALLTQVKETWGPVDILINNAGIGYFKKIIDFDPDKWDEMMNTNLKAAFLCARAVLPDMIERGAGHIINVVSVAGKKTFPSNAGYCASKFGLLGFTDVLRMETRQHGIKVTAFLPGATDTDIWGNANVDRSKMLTPGQVADSITSICLTEPHAMPEEVVLRPIGGDF